MPKKCYGKIQKQHILLEGESGKSSARSVCKRHGVPEQTYYRWRREALSSRSLFGLRLASLIAGKSSEGLDEHSDAFTGEHLFELPQPEPDPGDVVKDDPYPGPYDEGQLPQSRQVIRSFVTDRNKFAIEVHGKLPRGEFGFVPVALPNDLRERLEQDVRGSMSQAIVGLVRHALASLDRDKKSLHLYNEADCRPLPRSLMGAQKSQLKRIRA